MKLKRGDILINRWAGHIDFRYFIYLSTDKEGINGIVVHDGRFKKVRYYKNDLDVVMPNGKKAYEITELFSMLFTYLTKQKSLKSCCSKTSSFFIMIFMETVGLEPTTYALPARHSPS